MSALRLTAWSSEECNKIHDATLAVLAETGVDVLHEPALEVLRGAGVKTDGSRVSEAMTNHDEQGGKSAEHAITRAESAGKGGS